MTDLGFIVLHETTLLITIVAVLSVALSIAVPCALLCRNRTAAPAAAVRPTRPMVQDVADERQTIDPRDNAEAAWAMPSRQAPWRPRIGLTICRVNAPETREALAQLLRTRGDWLGRGRDIDPDLAVYSRLELKEAWSIDHMIDTRRYATAKNELDIFVQQLRAHQPLGTPKGGKSGFPKVEVAAHAMAKAQALGLETRSDLNEVILFHGTKPENLAAILANGLNERLSTGLFGRGTYLAEDAGKCDQYMGNADRGFGDYPQLHEMLYPEGIPHPGHVHYVLVCRALLGYVIRTVDGERDLDGGALWATRDRRELRPVPGVQPPTPCHSLLVELGGRVKRYREVVFFHSERVCAEYVVAYGRK
eukprot:gnl/TRDRNA2_/TRDRNA2_129150_c0_seq1.p1 gnl/TRDRNA2_/TRDRNA2_129150_c0~~gnl/TRDRNA2_/TRDRNA2_129150_c0_seq1.p1  ORF type:complete len:363 (+),score=45.30 gnl/TRDRNA2_/TRDRNA2_129150_c0_seq1:110-1198(+)